MCKQPLLVVQEAMYSLFDNISSEKFLIELLKETKIQNSNLTGLLTSLPNQFKDALDQSLSKAIVPYMENLLFGVNNLKAALKEIKTQPKNSGDVVDDLF